MVYQEQPETLLEAKRKREAAWQQRVLESIIAALDQPAEEPPCGEQNGEFDRFDIWCPGAGSFVLYSGQGSDLYRREPSPQD